MNTADMNLARVATAILLGLLTSTPATQAAVPPHDKAFWHAIAADHYHPPAGASVPDLAAELSDRLASPDPEWRDEIAYTTLASWIFQQQLLDAAALRPLVTRWLGNLQLHVGTTGTDDVFLRSFSALVLSVVVAHDNAAPFLDEREVRTILDATLTYFAAERDLRGFVPGNGWAHSAAHTSDLLKFLARSRYITPADQARILAGFDRKVTATPAVFVFGEDERMARAVLSVVKRADFDVDGFRAWVVGVTPKFPPATTLSLASLQIFQNLKNLLAKLEVLVAMDEPKSASEQTALEVIRAALKTAF
jgi:hypothetical protein